MPTSSVVPPSSATSARPAGRRTSAISKAWNKVASRRRPAPSDEGGGASPLCVAARSRRAREVASFDEPAKPWVVAIGIPFGILGQPNKMHVARLDGAAEPLEGRIALVES